MDLLADELNVKAVRFIDDASSYVTYEVKPRFDKLGPKYGGRVQAVAAAVRALPARDALAALAGGGGPTVRVGGDEVRLEADELEIRLRTAPGYTAEGMGGHVVILETILDEALTREGQARELVHHIQQLRKERGLEVSDRIRLHLSGDAGLDALLAVHREYILAETLATALLREPPPPPDGKEVNLDGLVALVALERESGRGTIARGETVE